MVYLRCRYTAVWLQEANAIWQGCNGKWSALQGGRLKKMNALLACYWSCSSLAKSQKPRQEYREHKQEMFVLSISSFCSSWSFALVHFYLFLFDVENIQLLVEQFYRLDAKCLWNWTIFSKCCRDSIYIYLRIPLCRILFCYQALIFWLAGYISRESKRISVYIQSI
jgi:hypothetical protein